MSEINLQITDEFKAYHLPFLWSYHTGLFDANGIKINFCREAPVESSKTIGFEFNNVLSPQITLLEGVNLELLYLDDLNLSKKLIVGAPTVGGLDTDQFTALLADKFDDFELSVLDTQTLVEGIYSKQLDAIVGFDLLHRIQLEDYGMRINKYSNIVKTRLLDLKVDLVCGLRNINDDEAAKIKRCLTCAIEQILSDPLDTLGDISTFVPELDCDFQLRILERSFPYFVKSKMKHSAAINYQQFKSFQDEAGGFHRICIE
ncbi:BA75_03258T0 [Komagataella pastoris]|uniref:BA75_03258T0 n=1 Tax=Komagataella pastoris TaxID=4922 RepID=A0A1B2JCG3_PICPA|nr:BA75_03258T0 [Komagataella pastoris]